MLKRIGFASVLLLSVVSRAWADVVPTGRYGGVPALSGCGAGSTLESQSFDSGGSISLAVAVITACTLTFSNGGAFWTTAPRCLVGTNIAGVVPSWNPTATALTMAFSLSVSGGRIFYLCW